MGTTHIDNYYRLLEAIFGDKTLRHRSKRMHWEELIPEKGKTYSGTLVSVKSYGNKADWTPKEVAGIEVTSGGTSTRYYVVLDDGSRVFWFGCKEFNNCMKGVQEGAHIFMRYNGDEKTNKIDRAGKPIIRRRMDGAYENPPSDDIMEITNQ